LIFLILIYIAFISLGLPDSLLGSAWPIMNIDLKVPLASAGYLSMIVSLGTIVSSMLSHRVIARFGTGKVTLVSVAMTAFALLGFYFSRSFAFLLILAIPLGLGAGAVDAGLNEYVAENYKARHMNWLHCFWGVGAMLGPIIMSTMLKTSTWRSGYLTVSIVQFVLVVLLIFSLPMWKKKQKPISVDINGQNKEKPSLFASIKVKGASFALLTFFFYTTIESSIGLWGASYLVNARQFSPENAAGWVSLFFLGITVGRAISGFVSIKLTNEILIRSGIIILTFGLIIMSLPLPKVFALVSIFIVGLGLAPIFPSMLHQTPVYFGKKHAQAAMGLQMAFAYTGATFMPPILGQIFSHTTFKIMPYTLLVCAVGLFIFTLCLSKKSKTNIDIM
jgi:fucose permease